MANIRETFRSYCEKKQNIKFPEQTESFEELTKTSRQEYQHNYYLSHKRKLSEYAKNYYQKNKDRISCGLTKFQQLLYNYYLSTNFQWVIPALQSTAIVLWKTTAQIFRSTESLVKKWKLERFPEWYKIKDYLPEVVAEPLFDSNEPDLYEDVWLEEQNKKLLDENAILQRKLSNAEDRYVRLLWEYTDYKNEVIKALNDFRTANAVSNSMLNDLIYTIE